jgi:hypothetical protein
LRISASDYHRSIGCRDLNLTQRGGQTKSCGFHNRFFSYPTAKKRLQGLWISRNCRTLASGQSQRAHQVEIRQLPSAHLLSYSIAFWMGYPAGSIAALIAQILYYGLIWRRPDE